MERDPPRGRNDGTFFRFFEASNGYLLSCRSYSRGEHQETSLLTLFLGSILFFFHSPHPQGSIILQEKRKGPWWPLPRAEWHIKIGTRFRRRIGPTPWTPFKLVEDLRHLFFPTKRIKIRKGILEIIEKGPTGSKWSGYSPPLLGWVSTEKWTFPGKM